MVLAAWWSDLKRLLRPLKGVPMAAIKGPSDKQCSDAISQLRECLENGAEDSILALLSEAQIEHLAEDFNEGRDE